MDKFDYFVVFAEMRTGSNLLEENLNQYPDLQCCGEVFNPHFIGSPVNEDLFGVTLQEREVDPKTAVAAIRQNVDGTGGFRFFHDHDPRMFDACMNDPRCGKVVLIRNPIDSYVSWQIAAQTGQWKLTNVTHQKSIAVDFDAGAFHELMDRWQDFQVTITNRLQRSAQTAFYISYEDLQDVDILNGLAKYLGSDHQISSMSKRLKKQNPAPLSDKVANFDEMEAALAKLDRFNLNRTPNFEPRRGPVVPKYIAAANAPLLFMPIQCSLTSSVEHWLADLDGVGVDALLRQMSQKDIRQWKRRNKGHRTFTVVGHPATRAYNAFCKHILDTGPECYTEVRKTLRRVHNLPIPAEQPDETFTATDMRAAFIAFLKFLKANLSGQTALRVDPAWASQSHIIQGFADFAAPDLIVRGHQLGDELAFLAAQTGVPFVEPQPEPASHPIALADIYDGHIETLVKDVYQKDYLTFGFAPLHKL